MDAGSGSVDVNTLLYEIQQCDYTAQDGMTVVLLLPLSDGQLNLTC